MKLSIATVCISGTLSQKLDAIAKAGFDGIEIFEQDFMTHHLPASDVGKLITDHGLEITLFQPFRDFETLPEPLRSKAFDRAERKFDIMQQLGTDLVLICSSLHPDAQGGIERAAEDLHELGERAAKRGLRVGYEALAWGKHISDHRDAWEIVRRADHENVGLILDSFHTHAKNIDPNTIRSIPGDKIFFVQLADAPAISMDLLYWSRHFRNMPGEGDLDVTSFMRAVMATSYDGPISLEVFNDHFRGNNAEMVAQDGFKSLMALMDDVRREEPSLTIDLPKMPKRAAPTALPLITFEADCKNVKTLSQQLGTLGFKQTKRHRIKPVSLWQQGAINLLVDEDKKNSASQHEIRVGDIGFEVETADDVIRRASHLGLKNHVKDDQSILSHLPALEGLAQSKLYFIDDETALQDIWDNDFTDLCEKEDNGITVIDHIAQTMTYEDMLSWSLFYSSLFEMHKTPMIDVIDPDGLVRSQALATPNKSLRVTLNGADTQRTLAGEFISNKDNDSVQHIAFASDDLIGTIRRLKEGGFETLPISPNYYEDLAARFTLTDEFIAELKSSNILYDEDGTGWFLHCYGKRFSGNLFIEILQRETPYDGYGGVNAPFRIAAQKRLDRQQQKTASNETVG